MVQAEPMDVAELRRWIEDALTRHQRDVRERQEALAEPTTDEVVDAVWGRLPLAVRREVSRAQVQASLTMLTLRHRFGAPPRMPRPRLPRIGPSWLRPTSRVRSRVEAASARAPVVANLFRLSGCGVAGRRGAVAQLVRAGDS